MFVALAVQAVLVCTLVAVAVGWQGAAIGVAALFGGAVALANSGLLVWRWWRGIADYHCDGQRHLKSFHRSGLERFFVVMVLMAVGLFGWRLSPGPLLIGLIAGQVAWVLALAFLRTD